MEKGSIEKKEKNVILTMNDEKIKPCGIDALLSVLIVSKSAAFVKTGVHSNTKTYMDASKSDCTSPK